MELKNLDDISDTVQGLNFGVASLMCNMFHIISNWDNNELLNLRISNYSYYNLFKYSDYGKNQTKIDNRCFTRSSLIISNEPVPEYSLDHRYYLISTSLDEISENSR